MLSSSKSFDNYAASHFTKFRSFKVTEYYLFLFLIKIVECGAEINFFMQFSLIPMQVLF